MRPPLFRTRLPSDRSSHPSHTGLAIAVTFLGTAGLAAPVVGCMVVEPDDSATLEIDLDAALDDDLVAQLEAEERAEDEADARAADAWAAADEYLWAEG